MNRFAGNQRHVVGGIAVAALVMLLLMRRHSGSPTLPGPAAPPGLHGQWTTVSLAVTAPSSKKSAGVPVQTRLGFSNHGRERIVVWLSAPNHPRPRPVPIIGAYEIQGDTLVQTAPAHRMAFSGLGLVVSHSQKVDTVTSRYE